MSITNIILSIIVVILFIRQHYLNKKIENNYLNLNKRGVNRIKELEERYNRTTLKIFDSRINSLEDDYNSLDKSMMFDLSRIETNQKIILSRIKKLEREVFGKEQVSSNVEIKEKDDKIMVIIDKD